MRFKIPSAAAVTASPPKNSLNHSPLVHLCTGVMFVRNRQISLLSRLSNKRDNNSCLNLDNITTNASHESKITLCFNMLRNYLFLHPSDLHYTSCFMKLRLRIYSNVMKQIDDGRSRNLSREDHYDVLQTKFFL